MEGDWVVLRHALFLAIQEEEWIQMHDKLEEVTRKIGVHSAGQRDALSG